MPNFEVLHTDLDELHDEIAHTQTQIKKLPPEDQELIARAEERFAIEREELGFSELILPRFVDRTLISREN